MGPGLLDLSDSNLRLWHGETLVQSPGYALLDGGSYQFGRAARAAASRARCARVSASHKRLSASTLST